jgi:predicted Zn-dependent peptidase
MGLLSRAPEVLLAWAARGLWLLVATRALWAAALAILDRGDEAVVVAALAPVYALIAWQLPRLRSRSVALLLLWFGVFAVRSVWNEGALGGVGLTPSGRGLALIVEGAGLGVGALAYFAAHRWRVERGRPLDWGDVARALLMLLGLAAIATIVVASRDAPYLDRLVHSAIAQAMALGVFVLWVLPRTFPPIEREEAPEVDAPPAPRVVPDDPFRELSLPDVDDVAGPPHAPPSRPSVAVNVPTAVAWAPAHDADGAPTGPRAAEAQAEAEAGAGAGAAVAAAVDAGPTGPQAAPDVAGAPAPASTTRRYAPTGARSARPARVPSTVVAAASVAAVAVAVVLETSRSSPRPALLPAPTHESAAAAGGSNATPALPPTPPPPVLDEGEPFGGQTLGWWSDALATASAGTSSGARARAALLRERLERAGLVLGPEQEVRVPPALAERRERMGLDEPPSVGRISVARGTLAALASAVREHSAGDRALSVPGGVRATLSPRPGARAALRVEFAIDPSHEGEEAALDRLALHALLFASAHEVEGWHDELERVGGAISIEHTSTSMALTLSAPAPEFTRLARRWLRVVLTPRLDDRRLPIARRRALADHVDADTDAEPAKRVAALVLDRYGFAAQGEAAAEIYGHFSATDVRQRLAVFAPANARVVVAGAFDVDALSDALVSYRGGVARPPAKLGRALSGTYRAHGLRSLHLVAYPLTLTTPTEVAEAAVFAALLEERLFHQLRDEGQAYVVGVEAVRDGWQDLLVVQVPLGPEASASLAGALTVALGRVARQPVEASELERSQRFVLDALRAADADPERRVRSALLGGPPGFVAELTDAVLRVEAAALPERVGTWIEPSRAIHVELDPWHGVRRAAPERSR